jgi:hypothetical protein
MQQRIVEGRRLFHWNEEVLNGTMLKNFLRRIFHNNNNNNVKRIVLAEGAYDIKETFQYLPNNRIGLTFNQAKEEFVIHAKQRSFIQERTTTFDDASFYQFNSPRQGSLKTPTSTKAFLCISI